MTRDSAEKDAVGILRGIKDRVEALEQAVSTSEGVPNLLRIVTDRVTGGDSATAKLYDVLVTDRVTGGDATDARENDAAATDQATGGDAVTATTDEAGGWTWDESHYDFDEWS